MVTSSQKRYPLWVAIGAMLLFTGIAWRLVLHASGGHFCYPLDDTFIHLSLADKLAHGGTWGINPGEYAAASSSPLYTLVLALGLKLGIPGMVWPFVANLLFGGLLLLACDQLLLQFNAGNRLRTVLLLCVVCFTPLPVMIASGMEHLLHAWLLVVALRLAIRLLNQEDGAWKTGLVIGIAVLARFESLFLLTALGVLLLYRGRWKALFIAGLLGVLPFVLFGIVSVKMGGHLLPNSVLLKGSHLQSLGQTIQEILVYKLTFGNNTMTNLYTNQFYPTGASSLSGTALLRLILIIPVLLLWVKPADMRVRWLSLLFLITALLHLALAAVGWLFRYEAYLVVMGILTTGILLAIQWQSVKDRWTKEDWLGKGVITFVAIFLLLPFPLRAAAATQNLPGASRNIYEQQYQMAQFLEKIYHQQTVAVNDIGAVSYFSHNYILDLWGLGTNAVADAKMHHHYDPAFLSSLCAEKQGRIAIIYEKWFDAKLLGQWQKVATWQITNNVICGDDTVTFYAMTTADAAPLKAALQAYATQLPPDVTVRYF